ncbi:OB-fold nucleic acid binding domain-containing protein [Actinomadura viridis]|uniref:OB-fold protein n=1 Tax=Actinomadura viridis TaxID=58110 RepID=A0A931GN21_9ACTN|nr:OB-fold domain-containing protein [Actinomadura viridis]MBG6089061.1 putative OB-fold protein [Actinomadura viridis]
MATGPPGGETPTLTNVVEYPYTRTTGPVLGPFLTGLRDGRILGGRCGGRVLCPPLEYDPGTAAPLPFDPVEVGPGGTVASWTWVAEPTRHHPFAHPFAFALILLDGADTPLPHAVDAGAPERMSTGRRVRARFRDERRGAITDLYFVPEEDAAPRRVEPGGEPVTITEHLISLEYREPLHPHRARFVQGLLEGRVIGQRSPVSGRVYVPGRGYDQLERVPMTEADDVPVADRGTVGSFTRITPVRYYGQKETEPYIRASILLDGSDAPITGVDVRTVPAGEFRVGMRLRAVWRPPGERDVSGFDNRAVGGWEGVFERWEPTGEPDADPRDLREHAW